MPATTKSKVPNTLTLKLDELTLTMLHETKSSGILVVIKSNGRETGRAHVRRGQTDMTVNLRSDGKSMELHASSHQFADRTDVDVSLHKLRKRFSGKSQNIWADVVSWLRANRAPTLSGFDRFRALAKADRTIGEKITRFMCVKTSTIQPLNVSGGTDTRTAQLTTIWNAGSVQQLGNTFGSGQKVKGNPKIGAIGMYIPPGARRCSLPCGACCAFLIFSPAPDPMDWLTCTACMRCMGAQ